MLISERDVLKEIDELEKNGYSWYPLGGNRNNEGQIQLLTDPIAGITERITNAIDGVLEKYYDILNSCSITPQFLAQEIKTNVDYQDFNNFISVVIHESMSKKENKDVTLEISDKGIGIAGEDFEKTILSLNGDNKISKKYLMGAYGQGGSTSIKFNEYTVIYSKKEGHGCVMTIIRYNLGDDSMKNGSYEFIALKQNDNFIFPKSSVLKEPGTKIINVSIYIKKVGSILQKSNSFYSLLNNRLFNPPLPISLVDKREKLFENYNTKIIGARKELDNLVKNQRYKGEFKIFSNEKSTITVRWWVIISDKFNSKIITSERFLKNIRLPFNFTMNGQTQGYIGSTFLNEMELSFLKKRFVCEIDLTNISKQEKRSILSSSRESISTDSKFWEELKEKLIKNFMSSSSLNKINKEIREKLASEGIDSKSYNKNLSKVLKNLVSLFAKGKIRTKRETDLTKFVKENDLKELISDDIELKLIPTFFNFLQLSPYEFSGDKFKLGYKTDGFEKSILEGTNIHLPSSLKLIRKDQKGSRGLIEFDASKMNIGDEVEINLDILDNLFNKKIIVRKINKEDKKKRPGYPKTNIIFVTKEKSEDYKRLDFNKKKPCVAEYSNITNQLFIYINFATYPYVGKFLKSESLYEKFKDHYSVGLGFYIISLIQQEEYRNSNLDEDYDYNPIAKILIWKFENILK